MTEQGIDSIGNKVTALLRVIKKLSYIVLLTQYIES